MVVYQLTRALNKAGHNAWVVGPGFTRSTRQLRLDVPVTRYPRVTSNLAKGNRIKQFFGEMELLWPLVFEVMRRRVDVIHAHSLYPAGFVVRTLKKLFPKIPLIVTPHGIDINVVAEQNYGMRLDPILAKKIDATLQVTQAATAISEGVERSLAETGLATNKIHRIGNGVDTDRFCGVDVTGVRERYGLSLSDKLILTVGNYSPMKGHDDLVELFPQVLERAPDSRLVMIGGGTEALEPLINALGLKEKIVLTGSIAPHIPGLANAAEPDVLAQFYASSELYVSASNAEGAEGLSLALLDALAAKLPVVATDIVGNRDVVEHGKNGRLVPPNDKTAFAQAVADILISKEKPQMARRSQEIVANFGWQQVACEYVALYQQAAAAKG